MMNVRTTQSKQAQAGFTLVELSIVLGVMTVLAVNFTPSFIAAQREGLAEQTVETYYRLADAAVAYRQNNNNAWPGSPDIDNECAISESMTMLEILKSAAYIPSAEVQNPWQGDFKLEGRCVGEGGSCDDCGLRISSDSIPESVNHMLRNLLPMGDGIDEVGMLVHPEALGSSGGGGDMPSGGIMMSEDICPDGWSEYTQMAGRMPVGFGTNSDNNRSFNTLGAFGADTMEMAGKSNYKITKAAAAFADGQDSVWDVAVQDDGFTGNVDSIAFRVRPNGGGPGWCAIGQCLLGSDAENSNSANWLASGDAQQVYSPYRVLNFCQKD